jgi:SNF2 family DNA or RNA helicase
MRYTPHKYQHYALAWLIRRTIVQNDGAALLLDPGLGKTSITLAWLHLLRALGLSRKVLIVAPLRVVHSVWPAEIAKWDQFAHLRCVIVDKPSKLDCDADIYLINPESLSRVVDYIKATKLCPFQTLVVDESSKFKSWGAKCTKLLRSIVKLFRYRLILTGTPSPNSLEDLFPQVFLVDLGQSLGTAVTHFREKYFYRGGYGGYQWIAYDTSQSQVESLIADCCLRLSAKDHLDLPELLINDVWVDLPQSIQKVYRKLEREMFFELESKSVIAMSAGSKYLLCKQLAGGGIYDSEKQPLHVHNTKLDAVSDLVEELQGKPAMIAFQFRHDLMRLQSRFKKLAYIDGSVSGKQTLKLVDQWNAGELPLLAVQPQALSHGINMQAGPGRDIIWHGLSDSLEAWLQLNARIHRQGVTGQVRIHRVLARKTVDVACRDRIERKDQNQNSLLEALNRYRSQDDNC